MFMFIFIFLQFKTGDPYVMKNEKFVSPALCCIPVGGGK